MGDQDWLKRVRDKIGQDCQYLGMRCTLVEVLPEDGLLVLRPLSPGALSPIQLDQFGQPRRRALEMLQVPLFSDGGTGLSEEAQGLLGSLMNAAPS